MKLFVFFIPILMIGCSPQSKVGEVQSASVNKPLKEDLIVDLQKKGVYEGVQTSAIDRAFEVVSTNTGETYYLKDNAVVSSSRMPKVEEHSLLYWRYRFKGNGYRETEIADSAIKGHGSARKQFSCDALGIGVVYDPNVDQVTQVFYYDKK